MYVSLLLTVLADAGKSVRYLAGRAVWQASATYRGGEAKTDAKDARVIADQWRMRGADLPVLHPDDDLVTELRMLTTDRADLLADRTRMINRLRQQLVAACPALERVAQLGPVVQGDPAGGVDERAGPVIAGGILDVWTCIAQHEEHRVHRDLVDRLFPTVPAGHRGHPVAWLIGDLEVIVEAVKQHGDHGPDHFEVT